jgi:hypothetical protein
MILVAISTQWAFDHTLKSFFNNYNTILTDATLPEEIIQQLSFAVFGVQKFFAAEYLCLASFPSLQESMLNAISFVSSRRLVSSSDPQIK